MDQLFDVLYRLTKALGQAGIAYRVVGGVAVFLHVAEKDPLAARATRDVDIAIDRQDLARVGETVRSAGFRLRHAAGVDLLVNEDATMPRSAVHLVFVRERVRPDYLEPVPDFSTPVRTVEGVLLAPILDLVRMKLTSFRLRDRVHIQDLDGVGLITAEIEAALSDALRARLAEVRNSE